MKRIEDDDFYYYGIGDPDETVKKRRRGRKKGAPRAPAAPTPTLDCDADEIVVSTETLWETPMSVLELAGKRYVIGSHLAEVVSAETFNLYSQARSKNIPVFRASDAVMAFLVGAGVMKPHAKNVSLIEIVTIDAFVKDRLQKRAAKRQKRREAAEKLKSKSSKSAARIDPPDDLERLADANGKLDDVVQVLLGLEQDGNNAPGNLHENAELEPRYI